MGCFSRTQGCAHYSARQNAVSGEGRGTNDMVYIQKIRKPRLEMTLNFDAKIRKYVRQSFKK